MEKNPVFKYSQDPLDDDGQNKLVHMKQPSSAATKKQFGHVYAGVAVLATLVLAVVALVAIIVFRPSASQCSANEELLRVEIKSLKQTLANDSQLVSKLQQAIEGMSNNLRSSQVQQLDFNEELQQQLDNSDLTIQLQLNNSVQKMQDLKAQLNASLQLTKKQQFGYLNDLFQAANNSQLIMKVSELQRSMEGISNILRSSQVQQLSFNEELQQQLNDSDLTIQLQLNNSVQKIQDLEAQLNASLQLTKEQQLSCLDNFFQYTSNGYCKRILQQDSTAPTGTYWLNTRDGIVDITCDFDIQLPPTGPVRGWQEIANINMSNPNDSCPSPLIETASRRCQKAVHEPGCQSILFPTKKVSFSKLCGRVVGYNVISADAFHSIYGVCGRSGCKTVDDPYVDGVSVTYSNNNGRSHVWSLAASHGSRCPCGDSGFFTPPFVGNDYYCEVEENSTIPLWDGKGCTGSDTPCCENPNLPWFCREFNQPIVTDNIEVRVCTDQHRRDEDIEVDLLKIYIQ